MDGKRFRVNGCWLLVWLLCALSSRATSQTTDSSGTATDELPLPIAAPVVDSTCGPTGVATKAIGAISLDVLQNRDDVPGDCFKHVHGTGDSIDGTYGRDFPVTDFRWQATGLVHNPLYFEDVNLERYGHVTCLQPALSAVKFFAAAPTLPYRMGVELPWRPIYTLGYARPGEYAVPVHEHLPWSRRGAAMQAGAVAGFVFLFP